MKEKDEERDKRISNEIIVDCYDDDEVNYAWFVYLEENLLFPFSAIVALTKKNRELVKERVKIVEFDQNSEGNPKVWAVVEGEEFIQFVPILDLEAIVDADTGTIQAIEDWKYWNQ